MATQDKKNTTAAAASDIVNTTAVVRAADAPTAAIQRIPTVDEIMGALNPDENTATGREEHQDGNNAGPQVAWIGFRSNKAKKGVAELHAAGVEENQFYLKHDGVIIAIKPFYVHPIVFHQSYAKFDDNNKVVGVSRVLTQDLRSKGYGEHLNGLAFVRLPGEEPVFVPATFSQHGPMTRAFETIRSILTTLHSDPEGREFKAKGPKFAAAHSKAKWKQFAVRAKIWAVQQQGKDPKKPPYNLGQSAIEATPLTDVAALNRFVGLEPETYKGESKKETTVAAALRSYLARRSAIVAAIARAEGGQ